MVFPLEDDSLTPPDTAPRDDTSGPPREGPLHVEGTAKEEDEAFDDDDFDEDFDDDFEEELDDEFENDIDGFDDANENGVGGIDEDLDEEFDDDAEP
jgi:hypothetical protein